MASTMASLFDFPLRSAYRNETRMWIESAMASVRMIVGAEALVGSKFTPMCPATPTAVPTDSMITANVARAAPVVRRNRMIARTTVRNIRGITTGMSA